MTIRSLRALALAGALLTPATPALAQPEAAAALVSFAPVRGGLALADQGRALPILVADDELPAARRAAQDLAHDIAAVSGALPALSANPAPGTREAVIVGTLGHSALVDALVRAGKLDARALKGQWESYVIATVTRPLPGVARALVIVGSDRRGTAYGAYEVARAIGVSPWHWWADVTPRRHNALWVAPGLRRFGPPAVRYRGIFINDEDWGLFPWAAQTFDPERGNIGPKTYAKVFELLLRLKANTLWPAMHKTTAAFNADPDNARLADAYGIVMGSSHSEVMLRNNVGEWPEAPERFNYATNAAAVHRYWEERVRANAGYEAIWTLGMRGLHDTGMVGTATMDDKVRLLGRVLADQRGLIDRYVAGGSAGAAQVFIPYKEVLDVYRAGLTVPDNVTIMWPDDNFGYIRQFPSPAEAQRPGGAGVYYHLSYLGYPLAYLWLPSTPPARVQSEMLRAWDAGARRMWIVNVGDIKPAEIGMSQFLDLAWNPAALRDTSQRAYLAHWLAEPFGADLAAQAAPLLDAYYRLNTVRRPEHLEWPAQGEDRHLSGLTRDEALAHLRQWRALARQVQALAATVPADRQDAWFELVEYPVRAAAAANVRFFAAEFHDEMIEVDPAEAWSAGGAIAWAEDEIAGLTRRFDTLAGGKWRHIMPAEPADTQWRIYRPRPIVTPAPALRRAPDRFFARVDATPVPPLPGIEAEDSPAPGWRLVAGMGRGTGALVAGPGAAPWRGTVTAAPGQTRLALGLLPMFPGGNTRNLLISVQIDNGPVQRMTVPRQVGSEAWVQGVLDNLLTIEVPGTLPPGPHRITVTAGSDGIGLDRVMVTREPAAPPARAQ